MKQDQDHRAREQTPYAKSQRTQQAEWKRRTTELPDGAKGPGRWQEAMRVPFILPTEFAEWNLWEPIREPVLALFRDESIAWHDEDSKDYGPRSKAGPTPHLLSSHRWRASTSGAAWHWLLPL
jgi:hypothetical protein